VDIGTLGLFGMDAGEPRCAGSGVVTASVTQRAGVALRKVAQHEHLIPVRFEGLHRRYEFEPGAFGLRQPTRRDDSVGDIDEAETNGRGDSGGRHRGNRGIEQRQSQHRLRATQKCAAIQSLFGHDHNSRFLLI
jgi:hypothetical protein